jgi:hypothetical protein
MEKLILINSLLVNQILNLTPTNSLFFLGIVIAVHGHENEKGVFIVKDYCFKELAIPKKLSPLNDDK